MNFGFGDDDDDDAVEEEGRHSSVGGALSAPHDALSDSHADHPSDPDDDELANSSPCKPPLGLRCELTQIILSSSACFLSFLFKASKANSQPESQPASQSISRCGRDVRVLSHFESVAVVIF